MVGDIGTYRDEAFRATAPGAYAAVATTVAAARRGSKLLPAGDLGVSATLLLPLTLCSSALLSLLLNAKNYRRLVGGSREEKMDESSRTGSVFFSA